MLFKELKKIEATIEFYDNKEGWRAFVDEVMKQNLPQLRGLRIESQDPEKVKTMQWTKLAIGAGWYSRLIKPLPVVVEIMTEVVREKEGPAHVRAALAGALAYLVRENDIIADSSGGGFGLVDDAMIACYAYYKYLQDLAVRVPEFDKAMKSYGRELESVMRTGLRIFPPAGIGELRKVLSEIAMGFYYLPEAPSPVLEQVIDQIIQRPRHNTVERVLSRLSYHLDVRFNPDSSAMSDDPILAMVRSLEAEAGSNPGELISEGYYY